MPSKKKKYNARFPAGRIKKIMQSDEEVGKVAQAVPIIISRTLELFVESLLNKTLRITNARNAKTLSPSHMRQCIMSENRFDFLRELVKNVPDCSVTDEQLPTTSSRTATTSASAVVTLSDDDDTPSGQSTPTTTATALPYHISLAPQNHLHSPAHSSNNGSGGSGSGASGAGYKRNYNGETIPQQQQQQQLPSTSSYIGGQLPQAHQQALAARLPAETMMRPTNANYYTEIVDSSTSSGNGTEDASSDIHMRQPALFRSVSTPVAPAGASATHLQQQPVNLSQQVCSSASISSSSSAAQAPVINFDFSLPNAISIRYPAPVAATPIAPTTQPCDQQPVMKIDLSSLLAGGQNSAGGIAPKQTPVPDVTNKPRRGRPPKPRLPILDLATAAAAAAASGPMSAPPMQNMTQNTAQKYQKAPAKGAQMTQSRRRSSSTSGGQQQQQQYNATIAAAAASTSGGGGGGGGGLLPMPAMLAQPAAALLDMDEDYDNI